jgi:uncharacterized protein YecE (DUF72 family)
MPDQMNLFGSIEPERKSVVPAVLADSVHATARALPANVRLGTSSWSFPGWAGIVYADKHPQSELSRNGLPAYQQHPLFRAVGVDRTFYGALPAEDLRAYADQVDDDFRFLVKAAGQVTTPWIRQTGEPGRFEKNPDFLDAGWATENVVAPFVEGLGARGGPLVFQFTPLGTRITKEPERFAVRLHNFLDRLPKGPWYAVEIRDRELLTSDYVASLTATGTSHCLNVHSRMPDIRTQHEAAGDALRDRVVVRWMLHAGFEYEEAKDRYSPFNRLVDEDPETRASLADVCLAHAKRGDEVIVIANNKAEGCAPASLRKLAEAIVERLD